MLTQENKNLENQTTTKHKKPTQTPHSPLQSVYTFAFDVQLLRLWDVFLHTGSFGYCTFQKALEKASSDFRNLFSCSFKPLELISYFTP